MPPRALASVILAAGKSTRMRSGTNKVLLPLLGRPIIVYQVEALRAAGVERIFVIVGFRAEDVRDVLKDSVDYVEQREQLGTGHALMQAKPRLDRLGPGLDLIVTVGDNPYLTAGVIRDLVRRHGDAEAAATLVTAVFETPPPYGRVIRGTDGRVLKVVEEFDATPEELAIKEVNASIYCFRADNVLPLLDEIKNDNAKKEYYLTDIAGILSSHGRRVEAMVCDDALLTKGINTPEELAEAEAEFKRRLSGR